MTTYTVNGFSGDAEEDIWKDGCQPDTRLNKSDDTNIRADTKEELIDKVASYFNCGKDNIMLDPCGDEDGRIDVQRYENEEGYSASESEVEKWKLGRCRLWLATYTGYVLECNRVKWQGGEHGTAAA